MRVNENGYTEQEAKGWGVPNLHEVGADANHDKQNGCPDPLNDVENAKQVESRVVYRTSFFPFNNSSVFSNTAIVARVVRVKVAGANRTNKLD